jgi:hypothetical protein
MRAKFQHEPSSFIKACWAATTNFLLPIAIAWSVVAYLDQNKYGSLSHLYSRQSQKYGPISLELKLSGAADAIPEPVVACGRPGNAAIVYIRLLRDAHVKVGVEFLDLGTFESDDFVLLAPDAKITFTCYLPELFPAESASEWGQTPILRQTLLRHQYIIEVDGIVRLKGEVNYKQTDGALIYYGSNPFGGSLVSRSLTGRILNAPGLK